MIKSYKEFSVRKIGFMIFLLALLVRVPFVIKQAPGTVQGPEAVRVAVSLAKSFCYCDAFCDNSGPTAHILPLNVVIQAIALKIFGFQEAGSLAIRILSCIEVALGLAFVPAICFFIFNNKTIAIVAGAMGALLPLNWWTQTTGHFEPALAFLMMSLALCCVSYFFASKRLPTPSESLKIGLLTGLTILTTTSIIPILMLLFVYFFINIKNDRNIFYKTCAIVCITALCTISPWIIRNYITFGHFIPLRSNLGLELHVSNNDTACTPNIGYYDYMRKYHPFLNKNERQKLLEEGEIAYNKQKLDIAVAWLTRNPLKFAGMLPERFVGFWFPELQRPSRVYKYMYGLITLSAFLGLFTLFVQRHPFRWIFLIFLLGAESAYFLVQTTARYRFPIDQIIFILATYTAVGIYDKVIKPHLQPNRPK